MWRSVVLRKIDRRTLTWIQWLLFGAVLGYGAWLRFRLPQVPLFDYDVLGYLSPAIDKLLGRGITHVLRNYFYPAFAYTGLRMFADFKALSVVQHLLGLFAGIILFLSWRLLPRFVDRSRRAGPIYGFAGVLLSAIYLTAEEPIHFEMCVRSEGILSFLLITNIYLALLCCEKIFERERPRIWPVIGIVVVVSCIATVLAKTSLLLGVIASLVPVAALLLVRGSGRNKLVLATGSLVAVIALVLPAWLAARSDPDNRTYLPTQLFVVHARMIREQISSDAVGNHDVKYPKELLREVEQLLTTELPKASLNPNTPTLGFNPDDLMFGPTSLDARLRTRFGDDLDQLCAFYSHYYFRTWLHRPAAMSAKIWKQMRSFYTAPCPAYWIWRTRDLSRDYRDSIAAAEEFSLPQAWASYPPFPRFFEQTRQLAGGQSQMVLPALVQRLQKFAARTYLISLLLGLGAIVVIAVHPRLRRDLGRLAAVVGLLMWWNFGSCLEVAIVHTLDVVRFNTIQIIFTVLTQFAAIFLVSEVARRAFLKRYFGSSNASLRADRTVLS
ncbi:MAG: hypothetical protein ACJ8M4_06905 [Chthoniobacterales bacterium]